MLFPGIRLSIIRAFFGDLSQRTRQVCFSENIVAHLDAAVNRPSRGKEAQTSVRILFEETGFSLTKREVISKQGLPICSNYGRYSGGNWEVAGYAGMFRGVKIRKYFYFLNNRFVFGEIRLGKGSDGFYRDASDTGYQNTFEIAHQKLCESIVLRYQVNIPGCCEGFCITDQEGNSIVFSSDGQYTWARFWQSGSSEVKKSH